MTDLADQARAELIAAIAPIGLIRIHEAEKVADAVLSLLAAERAARLAAEARVAEYEHQISWDTTCANCARLLDSCYAETMRAEAAEARANALEAAARDLLALKDGPRDAAYEYGKPFAWDRLRALAVVPQPEPPKEQKS